MSHDTKLRTMVEASTDLTDKLFAVAGDVPSAVLFETHDGERGSIMCPDGIDSGDMAPLAFVLRANKAARYLMVMEAFGLFPGSDAESEAIAEYAKGGANLADHPDKRKVCFIIAADHEGNQVAGYRFILKPEHGKPKLSPLTIVDGCLGPNLLASVRFGSREVH